MTYAIAGGLQSALYTHLSGDPALTALVGSAIYDALPAGPLPQTYVTLGSEEVLDRSDKTAGGAEHRFFITVTTDTAGFAGAKAAAAAVCDALEGAALTLTKPKDSEQVLVIAPVAATKAGEYKVLVSDGDGASTVIPVKINAKK